MYLNYYGLKQSPFSITATGNCFYQSDFHEEALAHVLYGINERKGLILLTGEVGTGKTTTCKVLMEKLPSHYKSSLILNPYFNASQLIQAVLDDFGIKAHGKSKLHMIQALNEFLLKTHQDDSTAVLIVDEAQDLSASQLEQLRLLSNLETEYAKLLQIVLVGQPELREKLSQYKLRQIKQRISVQYNLSPLSKNDIKNYIDFRISQQHGTVIFSQEAVDEIYAYTGGIPRLVNTLCDRALLAGFAQECIHISRDIIVQCIAELN